MKNSKKALLAGVTGTTLQWYDFALFGYFSPIIATTYFPKNDQLAALLSTFGVFAVGYLLAPLGSLFFGYIGDRFGRKRALTLSILAMAIPTAMISLIPGYQLIGIAAPILITLLRVTQGFVASSEFTGSAIFLVEHAKTGRKALYGCLTSSAYSAGFLLAGLAASFFTASFMPEWGWRLGFAVAFLAGLLIFYLRTNVAESPEYLQINQNDQKGLPFTIALKEVPLSIVGVIGIAWLAGVMTFGSYVFMATYLNKFFNISLSQATLIITIALAVDATLEPFVALLADRIGFLPVIRFGMVGFLFLTPPAFYLLSSGNVQWIMCGLIVLSLLIAITYAPLNAYMVSLFPQQYRYSAFGVAFNTGISLFGGTAPLIMIWLINKTGDLIAPAWYFLFSAVIGLISLTLCEYSRNNTAKSQSSLAIDF